MLRSWLRTARDYCLHNGIEIPDDLARGIRAMKSVGDIAAVSAEYNRAITLAIVDYATDRRRRENATQDFRRASATAFLDGFETGWIDGGGELPTDQDAIDWLIARQEQEYGFIGQLFQQIKDLRTDDPNFDYFAFATARADAYTATLQAVYNEGKLRAAKNKMLTFAGQDGSPDSICQSIGGTCVQLMGQRHRASWWIAHDLIPRPGNTNFDCGGWHCSHFLQDDDGNRFTQ